MQTFGARRSRSVALSLPCDPQVVEPSLSTLARAVEADLAADGIAKDDCSLRFEVDLRFMRQQWELTMDCTAGLDAAQQQHIVEAFKTEYGRRYGRGSLVSGTPVELVTIRAIGCGRTVRAELTGNAATNRSTSPPLLGTRRIHQGAQLPVLEVQVVDGAGLAAGHTLEGPALIDSHDTSVWIPAGMRAHVDAFRTINLETTL